MPQENTAHWRDHAIEVSEVISDGFEVVKAYGARIAEWVLFFCLFANILEMFPLPFPSWFGTVVLAVQAVTLDIAGFGLATMADHAHRRGDEKAAKTGKRMGWTLIILMIVTVTLITMSLLIPATKDFVEMSDKVLILARVIVTVFYGHIVHSLRQAGTAHENRVAELEQTLGDVQKQLCAKQREVATVQEQLGIVQKTVTSLQRRLDEEAERMGDLQHKLDLAHQRAASLQQELETGHGDTAGLRRELGTATAQVESLKSRLEAKQNEIQEMLADQAGIGNLRRELNTARLVAETLQGQLEAKQRELAGERQTVSSLRRELERRPQQQPAPAAKAEARHAEVAKSQDTSADSNVRDMTGPLANKAALLAEVYRLADQGLSSYEIEGKVHKPAKTIQRWLKNRHEGKSEANNEVEEEATGTDE